MTLIYEQAMGQPYPLGVSESVDGINIAMDIACKKECGIVIFYKKQNSIKIPFLKHNRIGNLYTVLLKGLHLDEFSYQIYADDKIISDPYARYVIGREKWGIYQKGNKQLSYLFKKEQFDWGNDRCPQIPYHNSIFYGLHVRGFTKHTSSKVVAKGTFEGVIEKIPYLKELGITAILCMPFYDFDEIIVNREYVTIKEDIKPFMDKDKETWEYKVNYWGFAKAQYFAPKASYSYAQDCVAECKKMIRELHKNGIECMMRMYFEKDVPSTFILDVLKYWVTQFHIDGFQLLGENISMELLAGDPLLAGTKIMGEYIPTDKLEQKYKNGQNFKNLAFMNDEFMNLARRFLKGDEDMLYPMSVQFRKNPAIAASINYITNYQGFTLMDLVSYDRKHNEANGEENRDGTEYNFSWNCGIEGKTKRKAVTKLRLSQIKNALVMMFLAQSVPMIQSGDEFGFSSGGNNNPYCQDNATTWLNWNLVNTNKEILDFVKRLIILRKEHPILHKEEELRLMDYISCGYPDLSYHSEEAWRAHFENYNRHLGVLYCGKYAKIDRTTEDNFIYVAYNMHWVEHEFALPNLPKNMKWYELIHTQECEVRDLEVMLPVEEQKQLAVPSRTIRVLIGK